MLVLALVYPVDSSALSDEESIFVDTMDSSKYSKKDATSVRVRTANTILMHTELAPATNYYWKQRQGAAIGGGFTKAAKARQAAAIPR